MKKINIVIPKAGAGSRFAKAGYAIPKPFIDVRSDYEKEEMLYDIISLIVPRVEEMLGCSGVLTKAPLYAVERIKALQKAGFTQSEHLLIGKQGYAYDGYWTMRR